MLKENQLFLIMPNLTFSFYPDMTIEVSNSKGGSRTCKNFGALIDRLNKSKRFRDFASHPDTQIAIADYGYIYDVSEVMRPLLTALKKFPSPQKMKPLSCLKSHPKDAIIERVLNRFVERSEKGIAKYGTTLADNDLSLLQWLNHLQEELMDAVNYIEAIKNFVGDDQ